MEICPLQRWHAIAVTPKHHSDLMNATPIVKVIPTLYVGGEWRNSVYEIFPLAFDGGPGTI